MKGRKIINQKTHMLVCLGSCLFTIASLQFSSDSARIAAGIVAGIGFIGAGAALAGQEKSSWNNYGS